MKPRLALLLVVAGAGAPGVARAQMCPAYTTCAFPPVNGTNPDVAGWNRLFEDGAKNELGTTAPALGMLEVGRGRERMPPRLACDILKPIAATESAWQQFCGNRGLTVISFDCGFGVMQVTSGAASYGPPLASSPAWNVGAGTKILIGKWNAEYGGTIGDSDPMVFESWYYAVWAYNGFTYGNNPDNPQHPPNRPPFGGPSTLSRGSYPYQEIVWGYERYPIGWRTTPRWEATEVSYPRPGSIGQMPGDLPAITPEHAMECKPPCMGDGCPIELIVDDADPAFELTGTASTSPAGGYADGFRYTAARAAGAPRVRGKWTFRVPATAAYELATHIPYSPHATSKRVPVRIVAPGGAVEATADQSVTGGVFVRFATVKLLRGVEYAVEMRDDSGDRGEEVGFDAIRVKTAAPLGGARAGDTCIASVDCAGDLICAAGRCAEGCTPAACAACDPLTGFCGATPELDAGTAPPAPDAGALRPDAPASPPSDAGTADAGTASPEEGCSCTVPRTNPSGSGVPFALLLALLLVRPRRPRATSRR